MEYYLGLGSNHHSACNMQAMLEALLELTPVLTVSRLIETEAVGIASQQPFCNAVAHVVLPCPASTLKAHLLAIENRLGRRRDNHLVIPADIDILQMPVAPYFQGLLLELEAFTRALQVPVSLPSGLALTVRGKVVGVEPTQLFSRSHTPAWECPFCRSSRTKHPHCL